MAKSGQSSKLPKCMRLIISTIHLSGVLDIVKVLIKPAFGETTLVFSTAGIFIESMLSGS